ncbi:MAG: alanine/glycine:cation symporter family protein [Bacillaceae bacterium]
MTELLSNIVDKTNVFLWSYLLIVLLIGAGLYFSIKTDFVQIRYLKEMFKLLGEGASKKGDKKGVSSFQAFTMSTASRVGTGNLSGVATAIVMGGPGAVFWMWLIALLGSASGFIESTLAQIYKIKKGDTFRGGPAYYIEKGLKQRWLGVVFAILITVAFGLVFNSVQANTIGAAFNNAFNTPTSVMGIILVALLALCIFGGVKRLAKITEVIVPIMAVIYLVIAVVVIALNITALPGIIASIVKGAFGVQQVLGGALGAAVMQGIKRGLFSNEAGMGSAPNAAATATVSHPVKQGLIQTLGVFTDTLIICTATAFIVLIAGTAYDPTSTVSGIIVTQNALASSLGSWAPAFVAIALFLFAFSSLLGNYYYGETNIQFIKGNKVWLNVYRFAVLGMVLFGTISPFIFVWNLADLFMGFMAIVNIYAIYRLSPIAIAALKDYAVQKKAGLDPQFYRDTIEGIEDDIEAWPYRDDVEEEELAS